MSLRRRILLALLLVSLTASTCLAHETTRRSFRLARQLALAQAKATAEDPEKIRQLPQCQLQIDVVEAEGGKSVPAMVRIVNPKSGKAIPLSGEIHRGLNWYSLDTKSTIAVPQMKLKIEALRGLETKLASSEIDLTGKPEAKAQISLQRFYAARFRGLRSGNTHLHLMKLTHEEAIRYLRVVPQSDDLDLVFLSHLRRIPDERHYISNRIVEESFAGGSLQRLSQDGVLFGNGQEHRHNFGRGGSGFGHVMLLDIAKLIRPVSIGPGIMRSGTDGIPLQRGIKEARNDGATVIWCHNDFGMEDLPNWTAGHVHAQNIFDGSERGTYADSYYRYLDLGTKVPFSTGTDWFIYDFARVYVPIHDELTSESWLAQLRAGKSFITNGPFLELETERAALGDTLELAGPNQVTFVARGMGRANFKGLELVYNGKVVHRVPAAAEGGYHFADLRFELPIKEPGWVALRIPLDAGQTELGRKLFAHTSPIYVEVAGKRIFKQKVASAMIDEMEQSMKVIEDKGVFANDAEREQVLKVYTDGVAELKRRIEQHEKAK
jgi:hypothetical protein